MNLLMAAIVYLSVSTSVASLQFDLDTTGSVTLNTTVQKQISTSRLADGKLRVLIYGLNKIEFSGRFAEVDGEVKSVTNVVGSKLDGTNANSAVISISKPKNLNAVIKK